MSMPIQNAKRMHPRMLITITRSEDQKKLEKVLDSLDIPVMYQCRGTGTAPSEIMDIFGLRGTTRQLTMSFLPKSQIPAAFDAFRKKLCFDQKGKGIAFTMIINGMQSPIYQLIGEGIQDNEPGSIKKEDENMKQAPEYSAIWVSVAGGYSDDVVDAARAAGARGGTVIKGRRRNAERISQYFGASMQDEQDFVMIIVPHDKKAEIMSAITASCGLKTKAHGVVISMPIDEVLGLEG